MATRKRYTKEFKDEACGLVTDKGYSQGRAAAELGLGRYTLRDWLRERRNRARVVTDPAPGDDPEALRLQVRELQRQVLRLETEKEILKKATAFFASQNP